MDPTVIMTILEKGSNEQVLMLKELHNAQLSKRNDEMFIGIANHLAGTPHLSSFVELYTQLALAVPEATPATSEAVSISPDEAPEETFEDEDEDVPDEEVIEPQAIEVEDMKVILRTRHTTAVKDGGAIKDHRQDPDWKNAALQYAKRLESRMNARIEMRELHNMKDIVSTVMQSTDNTASAVLTAYSVLMQKLNNDERVKYFGSLEKYSNCLQVLNQAQKAVKNILDLKRDEQKISEREKPILENWDWPRLENKVKEYLDQSPAPDSIENVEQFRFFVTPFSVSITQKTEMYERFVKEIKFALTRDPRGREKVTPIWELHLFFYVALLWKGAIKTNLTLDAAHIVLIDGTDEAVSAVEMGTSWKFQETGNLVFTKAATDRFDRAA
ncbi:hypothetical protein BC832DRAFT_543013 [Gaertneriomyces semiglobifer]|nr:hypothetical protein BC832DRAFT_543013 [Gaertneriomyces semiglobifer]